MKHLPTKLLFLVSVLFAYHSFGQAPTPLYAGDRSSNSFRTIDTTTWSVVSTVSATSDAGTVYGIFGISLNPLTDELYVLYENSSATNRRLGRINPMTGSITDIGVTGNHSDIDFAPDGTLYAIQGSWDGTNQIHTINPLTAAATFLYDPPSASWGNSMCFDPFGNQIVRADYNDISRINPIGLVETAVGGAPDETQAMVMVAPNIMMTVHFGERYKVNLLTGAYTFQSSMGFITHALGFGQVPCSEIDITASSTELCEGDPVTLSATGAGSITWDGGISDGVPFIPGPAGTYHYTPTSDSEEDCESDGIDIVVIGLPTVIAGSGDLNYCIGETVTLSAAGDADLYVWNDGEPLDLTPPIGTTTYTLAGSYLGGGCESEAIATVTITMHDLPTITATADEDLICIGNDVTFNGTGGVSYTWDVLGVFNGVPYTPNVTGVTTYTVTGTDEFNCSNTASVAVEVVPGVSIAGVTGDEIVGADGSINITVTGGAPAYTFDWDNDGTGDFDDTEDLTGLTSGTYTVTVQSEAGCSVTREFLVGTQLSVDEFGNSIIQVYPNPTENIVNIQLKGAFQFEIVSINGDVILSGSAYDKKAVSLGNFADGIYFVSVRTEVSSNKFKIVKK